MSSSSPVHPAGHTNTALSAVTPTLPGMPPEITDHILQFTPDSVRACRAVSRALREMGEGTLQELAERVTGLSSDSALYGLIQSRFAGFRLHLQSHPDSSCILFHLSLSADIIPPGVLGSPNRILSLQEIELCNNSQDTNLRNIWGPLREQIMTMGPQPAGIPGNNASAQQIRSWMRAEANRPALRHVTHLNLSSRGLTCVPLEIRLCTALQTLSLHRNQITSLTGGIFQGLTSLRELYLYRNQITSLTGSIFQGLISLQTLCLENNQIASLPRSIFQGLTSLRTLYLDSNQIASLPRSIFQGLTSLQALYLFNNQIASLPESIFQGLTSLRHLHLCGNQIASLPGGIFQGLPSLQTLSLCRNPRLLISYKDFANYSNNIEFPDMMRAFFNYTCQSPFARLYQLAAGEGSPDAVRESFSGLPDSIKNAIYGMVWVEAGRPNSAALRWGGTHAFDDMQRFYGALKRYVKEGFEGLNRDQQNTVHFHVYDLAKREGIDVDSVDGWGSIHAFDNILRLIDAMQRLQARPDFRAPGMGPSCSCL